MPPQIPGGNVAIINDTATGDATIDLDMTGMHYTNVKNGSGCLLGSVGTKTGASYIQHNPVTFDVIGSGGAFSASG